MRSLGGLARLLLVLMVTPGCTRGGAAPASAPGRSAEVTPEQEARIRDGTLKQAVLAGGCFWCMEGPFEKLPGVLAVVSGYTGGRTVNPTYESIGRGDTGHAEAVRIVYDPSVIDFPRLLDTFWRNIDPTQANGQFCDRGTQYRSAIFYADEVERKQAEESKRALEKTGVLPGPIVTEISPAGPFYVAEGYHQDFHLKQPDHYRRYREGCGRDRRLRALWGG